MRFYHFNDMHRGKGQGKYAHSLFEQNIEGTPSAASCTKKSIAMYALQISLKEPSETIGPIPQLSHADIPA